jgi:flagellar hook-basal body complex protein FliE
MDQIKAYQGRVNQTREPEAAISPTEIQKPTFGQTINQMVADVNSAQMQSAELRAAYERGENVPLTDVVIGMQKSSLAFEATLQIRNKVLRAYEEIMNMPV